MAEEKARDPTTPENKPVSIPLSKIHDLPGSVFAPPSQKSLEALTSSIVLKGVQEPVILRQREDGEFQIVSGNRRRKASELAKKTEIPAFIYDMTEKEARDFRLRGNAKRGRFTQTSRTASKHIALWWMAFETASWRGRSFIWTMPNRYSVWSNLRCPLQRCNTAIRTSIFAKAAMKHSFTAYCGWRKTHTTFDMYRNVKRNCSAFYRWSTRWKSRISALDGQNLLPCSGNGISTACGADLASMSFVKRPLLGVNP